MLVGRGRDRFNCLYIEVGDFKCLFNREIIGDCVKDFVDGVSFILGKIAGVFISLFIVLALLFILMLIFGFGETANYIINNTMLGFSYRYASGMVDLMGFLVVFLCFYMLSGAYCHMLTFTGGKFNFFAIFSISHNDASCVCYWIYDVHLFQPS